MKILIKKSVLESIVANTNPYLEKRDLSSITSHIFISAKEGILNIKATDHEIGLAYKVTKNMEINEEGIATANGKKLLDIIKGLKDGDIVLETKENDLLIKQNKSKYKLPMQNANDFPEFPNTDGKLRFDLNAGIFSKNLKKISPCIEINNSKPELTGALIDIKPEFINLVGTDGKRLAALNLDIKSQKEFNFILPKKALNEIQKLFYEDIQMYYDENIFIAISQNFEFFTKLINGRYPNYERVLPKNVRKEINLQRDVILDGIKAISMLSDTVKITFNDKNITFESINEDNSEANTVIDYNTGLDISFSITTKNRFVIDFLTNIEESEFKLGFNDTNLPFVFTSENLQTVIMPVNV